MFSRACVVSRRAVSLRGAAAKLAVPRVAVNGAAALRPRYFAQSYASSEAAAAEVDPNRREPVPFTGLLPDEKSPRGRRAMGMRDVEPMSAEAFDALPVKDQVKTVVELLKIIVEPAQGLLLTDLEEFPAAQNPAQALKDSGMLGGLAENYASLEGEDKTSVDLAARFLPNQQDEATIQQLDIDEDDKMRLRFQFLTDAVANSRKFYAYNDEFKTRAEILEGAFFSLFGEDMADSLPADSQQ